MKSQMISLLCLISVHVSLSAAEQIVTDFSKQEILQTVKAQGSELKLVKNESGPAVHVSTGTKERWPGISIPLNGGLDASKFKYLVVDIKSVDSKPLNLRWRIDSRKKGTVANKENTVTRLVSIPLAPGESMTLRVRLYQRHDISGVKASDFFGMRGKPFFNPTTLYLENLTDFIFFSTVNGMEQSFELGSIRLEGEVKPQDRVELPSITAKEVYPLIDEFGQFKHADWPGKTQSLEGMLKAKDEEAKALDQNSRPASWNQYGGWKDGPQLKATGWFYTAKHKEKWHLVDPEGRLFFSLGVSGIKFRPGTIIDEREHWFEKILPNTPANKGFWFPFKPSLERSHWYNQKVNAFRFHKHNILQKYGENYEDEFAEIAAKRLPAWGVNTIGNWSSPHVYLKSKVPYVAFLKPVSKGIEGSKGHWGKFCDVFDEDFVKSLRLQIRRKEIAATANDPMCIGYFVDNELTFGDEVYLALATLKSPASQRAKQIFVEDLRTKYGEISKLNKVWKSAHVSWDALLSSTDEPEIEAAREDLEAFCTKFVRKYFKTIRDELRAFAPNHLYLGCRYGSNFPINDIVMAASVEFIDVLSVNLYARRLAEKIHRMKKAGDKPLIIGEFHFGALDRGLFDTGLVSVENQEERAQAFTEYVMDCVKHPNVVGCHWFQFTDSPATGRPWDNENYQIGFTDVCDTPYVELIEASRKVGEQLYPAEPSD